MKIRFFYLFGHQFGFQLGNGWIGFKWVETPNWKQAGTVYLGFAKVMW